MKITLTIEVEDNKVTGVTAVNQTKDIVASVPVAQVENTEDEQNTKVVDDRTIGEALPKGRNAREYLPRTEEFPYNVADAKKLLEQNDITIGKLAKAMGNFPEHKLRNIFRYDNRRFTKQDFDVILKAIDDINDKKNIKI